MVMLPGVWQVYQNTVVLNFLRVFLLSMYVTVYIVYLILQKIERILSNPPKQ